MAPIRIGAPYSLARFWRCFILLVIATILSFFLFYLGQYDTNIRSYFNYLRPGLIYDGDDLETVMEPNKLDYQFIDAYPKLCYDHQNLYIKNEHLLVDGISNVNKYSERLPDLRNDIEEDYNILVGSDEQSANSNQENTNNHLEAPSSEENRNLQVIMLSISKVSNFKSRLAARQTWYKYVNKKKSKLIFFVGNPNYNESPSQSALHASLYQAKANKEKLDALNDVKYKFEKEKKDYGDIIQIDMPDNENHTSTKTIMAIRWAITYCEIAKNLFILSDSAVLNHKLYDSLLISNEDDSLDNSTTKSELNDLTKLNDSTIVGYCDYENEAFARLLRNFFKDIYKKKKESSKLRKLLGVNSAVKAKRSFTLDLSHPASANRTSNKNKLSSVLTKFSSFSSSVDSESASISKQRQYKHSEPQTKKNIEVYKGKFCSDLGWMVTLNGAKKLWSTALRSTYIMRRYTGYLNGYLAFKANLKHVNLFKYHEKVPDLNCYKEIENQPDLLLCAEDFSISSRYSNYIASWNSVGQGQFAFNKL